MRPVVVEVAPLAERAEMGRVDAPRLLVVSTDTVEAIARVGLRAPFLLNHGFATGRAFTAGGTPSAVVIDAEERIASDFAVCAPAVLALARRSSESARNMG